MDKYIVPTTHTHLYLEKEHTCTNHTLKTTQYDSKMLNRYLSDVFSLNKLREEILTYIRKEKARACRRYDVEHHEKLIRGHYYEREDFKPPIRKDVIKLDDEDFIFMCEHKEVYINAKNYQFEKNIKEKCNNLAQKREEEKH